jgi:hypothetical protein
VGWFGSTLHLGLVWLVLACQGSSSSTAASWASTASPHLLAGHGHGLARGWLHASWSAASCPTRRVCGCSGLVGVGVDVKARRDLRAPAARTHRSSCTSTTRRHLRSAGAGQGSSMSTVLVGCSIYSPALCMGAASASARGHLGMVGAVQGALLVRHHAHGQAWHVSHHRLLGRCRCGSSGWFPEQWAVGCSRWSWAW